MKGLDKACTGDDDDEEEQPRQIIQLLDLLIFATQVSYLCDDDCKHLLGKWVSSIYCKYYGHLLQVLWWGIHGVEACVRTLFSFGRILEIAMEEDVLVL
jgi:hypothetical protein